MGYILEKTMELLDKYKKELDEDIKINVVNIRDLQMSLPGIKHKWATRLINHKIEINKINSLVIKAKNVIIENQTKNPNVTLSKPSLEQYAEKHETIIRLKTKIEDEKFIVMYLEKVERILNSVTYDIKNLVDILKLEQL